MSLRLRLFSPKFPALSVLYRVDARWIYLLYIFNTLKCVSQINFWNPNSLLFTDKHQWMQTNSYRDCINSMSWICSLTFSTPILYYLESKPRQGLSWTHGSLASVYIGILFREIIFEVYGLKIILRKYWLNYNWITIQEMHIITSDSQGRPLQIGKPELFLE